VRIAKVHIQGFRCLEDVEVPFDDITTFIGPNGAGKSTILRALDWFFNGGTLSDEDVFFGATDKKISVRVDFNRLSPSDRNKLEKYARPGVDEFSAWKLWDNGAEKITGKALAFEPFERIRAASGATARKTVFAEVVAENPTKSFPSWTNETATLAALDQWERDNSGELTEAQVSSTNFFGFNSQGKLSGLFDFVLVTADLRASEESQDSKSSVIGRILEKAVDRTAADEALKALSATLATEHANINNLHFKDQLETLSDQLSSEVAAFASGRDVSVQSVQAEYKPQSSKFRVRIGDGSIETDVDRQGHGFQRSLLIASLKLLAERGAAATDGSVICLAIEEPELFQHPTQARAFATVLRDLAEKADSGMQVAYATHSPYFLQPRRYDQIRRVSRVMQIGSTFKVEVLFATVSQVVARLATFVDEDRIRRQVEGVCLNRLSEALFASAVVLVEGTGDRGVLEGVAERSTPLSVHGIAVAEVGSKTEFFLPFAILEQFAIPRYIVFDSDSGQEARKIALGRPPKEIADSKAAMIAQNRKLLQLIGEPEVDWPSGDLSDRALALPDHLENLLDSDWPEWEIARAQLVTDGLGFDAKDGDTYRLAAKTAAGSPPALLEAVIARTLASIGA